MSIRTTILTVTTTGDAGSASGSVTSETIIGELVSIHVDYNAAAPSTTDLTVSHAVRGGALLSATNSNTDALIHPKPDTADRYVLNQPVTVAVAQCDALAPAVTVTITVLAP